jgi:hypothetical protein
LDQFLFSNQWLIADIGTNKLIILDADGILEFLLQILNLYKNAALIIYYLSYSDKLLLILIIIKTIKMDIMKTAD